MKPTKQVHAKAIATLARASANVRAQLVAAQLQEWPDSRIMTHSEVVHEWMTAPPFMKYAEWCKTESTAPFQHGVLDQAYMRAAAEHRSGYHSKMLMSIMCSIACCTEAVFYECGTPDEHGRRFRGARFGIEGCEYMSGFPGGAI
jgi:hypothetical protein